MRINRILIILLLFAGFLQGCKDKEPTPDSKNNSPITENNGWELVAHTPDAAIYSNGYTLFQEVGEHPDGLDITYSTIFDSDPDKVQHKSSRWRCKKDGSKISFIDVGLLKTYTLGINTYFANLLDVQSMGMGDQDLYAINENNVAADINQGGIQMNYDYFRVVPNFAQGMISNFRFNFKSSQTVAGIGRINQNNAFVCNGKNARFTNQNTNIFDMDEMTQALGAAPKGGNLVRLGVRDSLLYVFESKSALISHSSGTYSENVFAVVVKNVYKISAFTGTTTQNFIELSRFFVHGNDLYVFVGMRNGKHRMLKLNLENYTLSSINPGLYEQMNLIDYKDVILLDDRPGDLLSLEKDGIHLLSGNTKTAISTPQIKVGTFISRNWLYKNGKIWHLLFDKNGSYLINKPI
jgi:hypothetical protein